MFKQRDIITAIEIGTSKICVLIGEASGDGALSIIGRGEVSSENGVVKGEISDMDVVLEKLIEALEMADVASGHSLNDSRVMAMSITGCAINSYQGVGTVFIKSEEQRVSALEINEAIRNAHIKPLPLEQQKINTFDAYYLLDGVRRVRNPEDQVASKLEAFVHVIHGDCNRIENFRSIVRDAGFEEDVRLVFSVIADVFGILTEEEKENGVLLVDMGGGTTEYAAVYNMGVLSSGVLPIGMEHVANDLSLGLQLNIASCRKILAEGALAKCAQEGLGFIEIPTLVGSSRKIPLSSFERIIEMRIRETFDIIRKKVAEDGVLRNLNAGGVITGGGALYDRTPEIFQNVFEIPVRIGRPYDASGALTDLADPRYSTIWGVLKYGEDCNNQDKEINNRSVLVRMVDSIGNVGDRAWRVLSDLKKSIKV